ncbi:MAG: toast rack family protein [Anaerolineaceae bacterium]|nr:toast rack family protein [Anaerolineaceae bacterium]
MNKKIFILTLLLILVSLACSTSINIPEMDVGETQEVNLNLPIANSSNVSLIHIRMGGGLLDINPGASGLIDGTITYNVADWEPKINQQSNSYDLEQEKSWRLKGIPSDKIVNHWDLRFSEQVPLGINIEAGAYMGSLDLSGMQIQTLNITEGASESILSFNQPNSEIIDKLVYKTGASSVKFYGLANANFKTMDFTSGAGSYVFDFGGELKQDSTLNIKSAVSSIKIILPEGMKVVIDNEGSVSNVNTEGTWTIKNNTYSTMGEGFTLTIVINMAVGNIDLIQN